MTSHSTQIRNLVKELTNSSNEEVFLNVKSKFLKLADDLEKQKYDINGDDINNLLDEIESKDNQLDNKELISILSTGFNDLLHSPYFQKNYKYCLNKEAWKELFITKQPSTIYIPLCKLTVNYNESDLDDIWDQMPAQYRQESTELSQFYKDFYDLATWFIEHKTSPKNTNKQLFDDICFQIQKIGMVTHFEMKIRASDVSNAMKYYNKYSKYIDINAQKPTNSVTVLHTAAQYGRLPMIDWLLSFKNIKTDIQDQYGNTPIDNARSKGHWDVVSKLTFASMGDKMREKSDIQIGKLNRLEGIINQWFRFYSVDNIDSSEYKSMVKMCQSIKKLIQKRLPVSDDLLMLCFHFELKQNDNDPLKCSIWNTLYNTLNNCLRIPLNQRNWLWFKQYIFDSSIWYQELKLLNNKTKPTLLYDLLIDMVSKQLKAQRDYLKPYIDTLEDDIKKDDQTWNDLKNYPEFIVTDNVDGLRQDECVEKGTRVELLPYPIRPIFSDAQLRKLNEKVKDFNCYHHYDIHGYLSKLVLIAHSLNGTFHRSMRYIFNVDKISNTNHKHGLVYHEGPVKRLVRSQAKAETDYASSSYPTTAKIIDFLRCCLVFDKPSNLLKGIEKFMNSVSKTNALPQCQCGKLLEKKSFAEVFPPGTRSITGGQKTRYNCKDCTKQKTAQDGFLYVCSVMDKRINWPHIYICETCADIRINTPLKRVLRLKNMFLQNKLENNNQWDLYKYSDIKMGVLMVYEGQSMIVEVQFLLQFMLTAKGLGHGLYEIERNKEFICDVHKIMHIEESEGINQAIRTAVIRNNSNQLATLILNNAPIDLMRAGEGQPILETVEVEDSDSEYFEEKEPTKSILRIACEKGNKKVLKLLLDTVELNNSDDLRKLINQLDGKYCNESLIHFCVDNIEPQCLRVILKYEELDVNIVNDINETALLRAAALLTDDHTYYKGKEAKRKQIYNILKNDKRTREGWVNRVEGSGCTIFLYACQVDHDVIFIKELWQSGVFTIDDTDNNGETALMKATKTGKEAIVKFLLTIPEININETCYTGAAIDFAIKYNHIKIVQLLYDYKKFDLKAGNDKLELAMESKSLEIIKLVLKLWSEIDVTASKMIVHKAVCLDSEILEFILSFDGINSDVVDDNGFTPWLYAIDCGQLENCKLLWKRKDIDFEKKNDEKNARDIAIYKNHKEIINWLDSIQFLKEDV